MSLKKVLLVDDDEVANFLNKILIDEMAFAKEIHVARNGQEALDFINRTCNGSGEDADSCIDLIFLDINMPVMNGFDFLDQIHTLSCKCGQKVIMLTTSSNQKDMKLAEAYNLLGYINKPLSREKINEILESAFA